MTELVRNDSLELVARQELHRTCRDSDDGIFGPQSGDKRIDARLAIQNINCGDRHSRSDGHFLDDVLQLALVGICRRRGYWPATERNRNGLSAFAKLYEFGEGTDGGDDEHDPDHPLKQLRVPK